MININLSFNEKLAGVALIIGVSVLGVGHLVSVFRGDDIKISKEGYLAKSDKKKYINNKINEEKYAE